MTPTSWGRGSLGDPLEDPERKNVRLGGGASWAQGRGTSLRLRSVSGTSAPHLPECRGRGHSDSVEEAPGLPSVCRVQDFEAF